MTTRFVMGRHPLNGQYGIWLSRPGINALSTVDPISFLLCPSAKNQQIVKSGSIYLAPNSTSPVYFNQVLQNPPRAALISTSDGGQLFYPCDFVNATDGNFIFAYCYPDVIVFGNATSRGQVFHYMIYGSNDIG